MEELKMDIKKLKSKVKFLFGAVLMTLIGWGVTVFWFYFHPIEKIIVV